MARLSYKTVQHELVILHENPFVTIKYNGVELGKFSLESMWDFVRDALAVGSPTTVGLQRRTYEARNVWKLTNEFLASQEE